MVAISRGTALLAVAVLLGSLAGTGLWAQAVEPAAQATPAASPTAPSAAAPAEPSTTAPGTPEGAPQAELGAGEPQPDSLALASRLHNEGGKLFDRKEFVAAANKYCEALRLNPNLVAAWFDLSLVYVYGGQAKFAEKAIERVRKLGGNTTFLESELAKVRPGLEQPAEPPRPPSKTLEVDNVFKIPVPGGPPSKEMIAKAEKIGGQAGKFIDSKQFDKAIELFKQALSLNPGLRDAWFDLCLAYLYSRDLKMARAAMAECKKLGGDIKFLESELAKCKGMEKPESVDPTRPQTLPAPPE
jgi:tetratricopeptide (TPR) repeat protein